MKNLLRKEFLLASHPTTYLFLSFGLMMLIPSYPGYVQFIYTVMSLFFVFLTGRENKDLVFTVSLPIRKRDVVKARCLMISLIEGSQVAISVPFAFIASRLYALNGTSNMAGIEPNVAFYGFVFILLALFNLIFIPWFYKTGYKVGVPFVFAMGATLVYFLAVESLVWIPSPVATFLDTLDLAMLVRQIPILLAGLVIWIASMVFVYHKSAANFDKVDL